MADQTRVDNLKAQMSDCLTILNKELVQRSIWGEVNFKPAELDIKRCKDIVSNLSILPIEYLPDAACDKTVQNINQVRATLLKIDTFSVTQGTPIQNRDQITAELHGHADNLYTTTASWIPFLAYQRGDVEKNITKLSENVQTASELIEQSKLKIEKSELEIKQIITKAREASASAGAAVFTQDFKEESDKNETDSLVWLKTAITLAIITLLASCLFICLSYKYPATDSIQAYQILASKVVILMILITATLWAGRNYRILKHLKTSNNHRALTLRTLQAFTAAASDDQTKNAVLLEANRAIFTSGGTGFIDDGKGENPLTIIELAKSFSKKGS
jgi:hypothetical protein